MAEIKIYIGEEFVSLYESNVAPRIGDNVNVKSFCYESFVKTEHRLKVTDVEHVIDEDFGETSHWINVITEEADR